MNLKTYKLTDMTILSCIGLKKVHWVTLIFFTITILSEYSPNKTHWTKFMSSLKKVEEAAKLGLKRMDKSRYEHIHELICFVFIKCVN